MPASAAELWCSPVMAATLSRVMSFSTAARAFSGRPCVSSMTSSTGRPLTPPASLMILAATSSPSRTCVPWTTEPGGDWVMVTPTLIGSAACAPAASASRQTLLSPSARVIDPSLIPYLPISPRGSRSLRFRGALLGGAIDGAQERGGQCCSVVRILSRLGREDLLAILMSAGRLSRAETLGCSDERPAASARNALVASTPRRDPRDDLVRAKSSVMCTVGQVCPLWGQVETL